MLSCLFVCLCGCTFLYLLFLFLSTSAVDLSIFFYSLLPATSFSSSMSLLYLCARGLYLSLYFLLFVLSVCQVMSGNLSICVSFSLFAIPISICQSCLSNSSSPLTCLIYLSASAVLSINLSVSFSISVFSISICWSCLSISLSALTCLI